MVEIKVRFDEMMPRRKGATRMVGAKLDVKANNRNDLRISTEDSKVSILVIPMNKELMIAQHAAVLVGPDERATDAFVKGAE